MGQKMSNWVVYGHCKGCGGKLTPENSEGFMLVTLWKENGDTHKVHANTACLTRILEGERCKSKKVTPVIVTDVTLTTNS